MIETRIKPEKVAEYKENGWWLDKTIIDYLKEYTEQHPDKAAIVSYMTEKKRVETVTYRQLNRLVDRFAGALIEAGIKKGDVVAIQLPNWWHVTAIYMACSRIGAVITALAPILRKREVSFILERMKAPVCIVPDTFRNFDYAGMLADLKKDIPTLRRIFVIGDNKPEGTEDFNEHFMDKRWEDTYTPENLDEMAPAADEVSQILFTSGTTGEPKGVVHTQNTLVSAGRVWPELCHMTNDDVVLMAMTMGHQGGFLYGCHMPFLKGMKAVYLDQFDVPSLLQAINDEKASWTVLPPPTIVDIVSVIDQYPYDLSSMRLPACGGAPVPPHFVDLAKEKLGLRLYTVWGMTENGPVTILRPEDPLEMAGKSDGRPAPWMEVRIADDEGNELPRGEAGRLLVRGPNNFLGYFQRPELYDAAVDEEGWFDTGDLARMDENDYVRITGRTKEIIIRGGENIPVVEIEAALVKHPKVREVAVIGVPDERLGERGCAVVVPEGEPPTLEDLTSFLNEMGMSKHFWPERLEIVEGMPRTAFGKVQKFVLRDQILAKN